MMRSCCSRGVDEILRLALAGVIRAAFRVVSLAIADRS